MILFSFFIGLYICYIKKKKVYNYVFCITSTSVPLNKAFSNRSEKVGITDNPFYVDLFPLCLTFASIMKKR